MAQPDTMQQSVREQNIQAFLDYWRSGVKPCTGAVGIELEHTLVHAADGSAVPYAGERGVQWVLEQLLPSFPAATRDGQGDLLGVARQRDGVLEVVTLEPAAQLELSAGPFSSLSQARACFDAFEAELAHIVEPAGIAIWLEGYHPTAQAAELTLIPKQRYEYMNRYFERIGPWGARMMRGSASTQVSIDYADEADCLRKLRIAFRAAPLFALMCDNAPTLEGEPYGAHLARTRIWQGCDPARCGIVPGVFGRAFSLRDYAEYVLGVPAVLVPEDGETEPGVTGNSGWRYTEEPFGNIYAQRPMTRADVEHAVSMTFTDARLKTYIELRPADAMPVPYAIAYAALIKGLFANEETLSAMETLLFGAGESDASGSAFEAEVEAAKKALVRDGYAACVYGRPVADLAQALVGIARSGLSDDETAFLKPLADLVAQGCTQAVR